MKKIIALALSALFAFGLLTACGNGGNQPSGSSQPSGSDNVKEYTVGICNYVDDASLNQIVDNIKSQLETIGNEKGVKVNIEYDNCNADATVFTGFLYDMWSGTYMPMSYVIDFGEADGISNAMLSGKEPEVNFEQGRLHVKGELKHVRLYDTAGRIVAEGASELYTRILPGCYIIRTEDSEGNVWAERVQVK